MLITNPIKFPLVRVAAIAAALLFTNCAEDFIVEPFDAQDYRDNFQALWEEADKLYPYFEHKNIDWQAVRDSFSTSLEKVQNDEQFLPLLLDMLGELKDGHVTLTTPAGEHRTYSVWRERYRSNFNPTSIKLRYARDFSPNKIVASTLDASGTVGKVAYLYIPSFKLAIDWKTKIDALTNWLQNFNGAIIDVRSNPGGYERNMRIVASRFADKKHFFSSVQFRNGRDHTEFTEPIQRYIEPAGGVRFLKPVVILTNRRSLSATESFVLAMAALPHVTVLGDTTGGSSGNPIEKELPIGWTYTLSTWIERAPGGTIIEGNGIAPDTTLHLESADLLRGRDTYIEAAKKLVLRQLNSVSPSS